MKHLAIFFLCTTCMATTYAATPMDSLINTFKMSTGQTANTNFTAEVTQQPDTTVSSPANVKYPQRYPVTPDSNIDANLMNLNFEAVNETVKKLTAAAKRKREATAWLEEVTELTRKGEAGLRGVDNVVIVDSVVVDKSNFLSAYPLHDELGTLTLSENGDIVQYQTQLNGMVLCPQPAEGGSTESLHLVRYYLEDEQLVEGTLVEGLNVKGDLNYPFLMPDGLTLYFAARSDEGYGNYDLYATRYDSEAKRFYQAENMGFPYNSLANDYMMVIDEAANLGWFASDRYQPEDKVCIYTFIPNSSRHTIDYESTDLTDLKAAASLHPLAAMPFSDEQRQAQAEAKMRARQLTSKSATTLNREFEFVLNDSKTCYQVDDFTTDAAKQQCREWIQKSKNLTTLAEQLQQLRDASPSATQEILNLEKRIVEQQGEVHALEKQIRTLELSK